jgi:hypothetical protein
MNFVLGFIIGFVVATVGVNGVLSLLSSTTESFQSTIKESAK